MVREIVRREGLGTRLYKRYSLLFNSINKSILGNEKRYGLNFGIFLGNNGIGKI